MTDKQELVLRTLERAADQIGDVTAPVIDLFYRRNPEGRDQFNRHDLSGQGLLQGTMVEQAIYCLMYWNESPGEIEVILLTTIPHHIETLAIDETLFSELMAAVCDVVGATIPPGEEEQANWKALRETMLTLCARGAALADAKLRARAAE